MPYTGADALHEIREYSTSIVCAVCGECAPIREVVTSDVDESLFCSEACRYSNEAEYHAYIAREMARAAREFRNRTPQQARRVSEWNTFADAMNSGKPLTGAQVRQMHD